MLCGYTAGGAASAHEIADGGRSITVDLSVDWGKRDVRDVHGKTLVFCSFGCLAAWAAEKARQHDAVVQRPVAEPKPKVVKPKPVAKAKPKPAPKAQPPKKPKPNPKKKAA